MKTPEELAVSHLGPESHKRRSTAIRRVSGGLQTEISSAAITGLSASELNTLQKASVILNRLGSAYSKASTIAQRRNDDVKKAEASIRKAMDENFGKLTEVPGQVALIGAIDRYKLSEEFGVSMNSVHELDQEFRESMNSLAYSLAGQAKGRDAATVVAEAWSKFEGWRSELERKYSHIIRRLSAVDGGGA